jgi:hypothetical protein
MGTVHKFKRPPKNEQQFRGYSPQPGGDSSRQNHSPRRLTGWQQTALAWSALILAATAIWAVGALI